MGFRRRKNSFLKISLLAGAALITSACSDVWFGGSEAPPLPGKRISVLLLDTDLEPDPRLADLEIKLPKPYQNRDWPQASGFADHAMHHLAAGTLRKAWEVDFGYGGDDDARLLSSPVIVDGVVYIMDIEYRVSAYNKQTGKRLWRHQIQIPEEDEDTFGGGVSYYRGRLFVSTGFAEIVSLMATDGTEVWRNRVSAPVRSAPTIANDVVLAVSIDNQTQAFDPRTGEKIWSHAGFSEVSGVIGGGSAAVADGVALVPYSSGEVYALRVKTGRVLWSDSLSSVSRFDALASLSDIRGAPLIDRGIGYAVSQAGRMVALDMKTGARVWDRRIGGINTPWIAGDYLFVLANDGNIAAVTRRGGRVVWLRSVPVWDDVETQTGQITWVGPVLAGDRLIIANDRGDVIAMSPYTGDFLGHEDVDDPVKVPPVVADGAVYIQTENGYLHAFK